MPALPRTALGKAPLVDNHKATAEMFAVISQPL